MDKEKVISGFLGAGGIARSHVLAVNSLRYYYNDVPEVELEAVCSATKDSRERFALQFGFNKATDIEGFVSNQRINTVYILGPNKVHYEHLKAVAEMPAIRRIYVEKPLCSSIAEEELIRALADRHGSIRIQVGYQYHFSAAVREALLFWRTEKLGNPVHFEVRYYHGDYLNREYRNKRATRLTPAPDGGAMADLGSHGISLITAFLGEKLLITGAFQAGHFDDVTPESDLFSQISLYDDATKAAGYLAASRVSSGTGDLLSIVLYAEKGTLKYSTEYPDQFEYFLEEEGRWTRRVAGSNFRPVTSFPSGHVPAGWLRSMIHAHYVFLTGNDNEVFVPDVGHGLAVQRLVRETADELKKFREKVMV